MVRALKYKETIKVLEKHGYVLRRQNGSHMIYKHIETGVMVPIPMHGKNSPIKIGTFKAIIKQSRIAQSEFE